MDQWKHVDEIVAEALVLAEADRSNFIDQACRGNTDLRQEVDALLAIDTSALSRIDKPAFQLLAEGLDASEKTIGPYEIEKELGRGGMAVVYQARRTDGTDSRPVAIKVLKRGMDTDEIVRRFRREGDILAALRHPHIARVFGGGVTADQRPYLVMELVKGQPIDQYCAEHKLPIADRVRLLLPVCSAISYAHSNLVVHRDLKPSNILVTRDGTAKVLDFGISKLLDPTTTHPATMTATGLRLMTPEYAAPEQFSMTPISTATDVYGLGVVLFELLTGQRPFQKNENLAGFLDNVLKEQPERPSVCLLRSAKLGKGNAKRLARLVAPDLDPIVLKALRKEPHERYTSMGDLAQDLQSFLDGRPVVARTGSFRYRTSKLVQRRYREILAAALLFFVMAGVGIDRELSRRQIIEERNKAVAVQDYLSDLFVNADLYNKSAGGVLTVEGLIDHALKNIEKLDSYPFAKATFLYRFGAFYGNSGELNKALNLVEKATDLFRTFLPKGHIQTAKSEVLLAEIHTLLGQPEDVERMLRQAIHSFQQSDHPDAKGEAGEIGAVLALGRSLTAQDKFGQAIETYHLVLDALEALPTKNSRDRSLRIHTWLLLGSTLSEQQNFSEAALYFRKSWNSCIAEWGKDDTRCLHPLGGLAEAVFQAGSHDKTVGLIMALAADTQERMGQEKALGDALVVLTKALKIVDGKEKAAEHAKAVFLELVGPDYVDTVECKALLMSLSSKPEQE